MAWTDPRTWASNEVVTAANMNTHIRDNLDWLANDHPRCRATRTAVQSIGSGSDVAVAFTGAESYDVGPMHAASATTLVVPAGGGGVYAVTGFYTMAVPGGTFTRCLSFLRINGSTDIAIDVNTSPASTTGPAGNLSADINLVPTNTIELIVNQNAGAAVNLTFAALTARWVAF